MTQFSIKDLSDFSGIKQHTIRIWEQRFDFLKPGRNENLRRRYTTEELNLFLHVSLLNQSGFKVSRIARMSESEKLGVVDSTPLINQQLKTVNELIICMAEMDPQRFEAVLNNAILSWGIHDTIAEVLHPFCERVGLWQKPDSKNYLSNILLVRPIIHQKIHAAIDQLRRPQGEAASALLFLPQGESAELNLLYLHYMLLRDGIRSSFLGRSISVDHLHEICSHRQPDFLLTRIVDKTQRTDLAAFLTDMPQRHPGMRFINMGPALHGSAAHRHYKGVQNFEEARTELQAKA